MFIRNEKGNEEKTIVQQDGSEGKWFAYTKLISSSGSNKTNTNIFFP